jgi:nucleotide-binding universal stress UspA family protein
MNMTVIVGVDSSEASKAALRLAAQEARWRQASLVAVSAPVAARSRMHYAIGRSLPPAPVPGLRFSELFLSQFRAFLSQFLVNGLVDSG